MLATQGRALHRGLPSMKGKNLSNRVGIDRRLFMLLLAQFAANSGKGFSQVGFHAFRVTERRIEDGLQFDLHNWCCEIHHYSTRLRPEMTQETFHTRPNCE